ncbi:Ldh family oxidoreductase [Anianabacter salinae]|uniref:Ldh family oxidoreductase n=1 Tax=Anianabacter salinae TaxID=2851023 RepID=UPI00225E565F|nr:Ldh family oxidoreductase [Anianabacter salinae]MBV0914253.1 Ldh family oxidoreductase [Anianabacter salinae]
MTETTNISIADATGLIHAALTAAHIPADVAACVARALVAAEAEGQAGHGFSRLGDYVSQARSGKINVNARITLHARGPASLLVDADRGFAFPALDKALAAGLPQAWDSGISVMAVANSHHCGALSVQVEKIAAAGLIGIMVANAPKAIAPWGGTQPFFGTNPIAFATPQANGAPLVIDLSLSRVARGKVMNAHKANQPIPLGWALDVHGKPTTDPEAALSGTMLPIGEAKGTALALMVEILAAAFTGSAFSHEAGSFFSADGPAPRVGQTLIVLRPDAGSDYLDRVSDLLAAIEAVEGVRLPGERRRQAISRAEREGLSVRTPLIALARSLAGEGPGPGTLSSGPDAT